MVLNQSGSASKVENGDDKNKSGSMSNDTINWNPSILSILDAIIKPIPIAMNEIKTMKTKARIKLKENWIETPKNTAINKTINPCINAVVAPPNVLPITIDNLLTGATKTSCKNPNCLSHKTDNPTKTEGNKIDHEIIPGVKMSIYSIPEGIPGNLAELKPNPNIARKKNG